MRAAVAAHGEFLKRFDSKEGEGEGGGGPPDRVEPESEVKRCNGAVATREQA